MKTCRFFFFFYYYYFFFCFLLLLLLSSSTTTSSSSSCSCSSSSSSSCSSSSSSSSLCVCGGQSSMRTMHFTEENIGEILRLLAGILHAGNIEFMTAGGAQVSSKSGQRASRSVTSTRLSSRGEACRLSPPTSFFILLGLLPSPVCLPV